MPQGLVNAFTLIFEILDWRLMGIISLKGLFLTVFAAGVVIALYDYLAEKLGY